MTSKERAALRAQANSLEVLFHVGKGGIGDTLIAPLSLYSKQVTSLDALKDLAGKK